MKPWEQVPESTTVRPEELKNLQWEELAKKRFRKHQFLN